MPTRIAVLASMEHEIREIENRLLTPEQRDVGGRRCVLGDMAGHHVITSTSGYGKVAAAATVTTVLDAFAPDAVIFGGVAGGIGPGIEIGDVVVANRLVQHDFDASPIFERFVIPSLGVSELNTDPRLTAALYDAATAYIAGPFRREMDLHQLPQFDPNQTKVHTGLIASGDRFVHHVAQARTLLGDLPEVLAVEMEGAAVAQVCLERGIPYAVFRSVSDRADQHADVDFLAFIATVAAPITAGVLEGLLERLS